MDITGSVALVTGGNRGLGKAFVQALLDAGVQKIYVGARHLTATSDSHLQPLKLDITNPSDIAAAAAACQDVTLLINNAGVGGGGPLLAAPSMEGAHEEVLADQRSQEIKAALATDPRSLHRRMQQLWDDGKPRSEW